MIVSEYSCPFCATANHSLTFSSLFRCLVTKDESMPQNLSFLTGKMVAKRPMGVLPVVDGNHAVGSRYSSSYCDCSCWYEVPDYNLRYAFKRQTIPSRIYEDFDNFKYEFVLDKRLRLNLTLFRVNVLPAGFNCSVGYIHVHNEWCTWTAKLPGYTKHLKYCGIHAKLSCFSASNCIDIMLKSTSFVVVKAQFAYSVLDEFTIDSYQSAGNRPFLKQTFYILRVPAILNIYRLNVDHFRNIVILLCALPLDSVQMFDGPGRRCQELKPTGQIHGCASFCFSTFQALVFIQEKKNYHSLSFLNFSSKSSFVKFSTVFVNNIFRSVTLPKSETNCYCGTQICFVQLITQKQFTINVTWIGFTYKGQDNTEACNYAGLAFYDHQINDNSFNFVRTECVKNYYGRRETRSCKENCLNGKACNLAWNRRNFKYQYPRFSDARSIYSTSNKFLLVLYSYSEYGLLGVNISVASTQCKGTYVDLSAPQNLHKKYPDVFSGYSSHWKKLAVLWKVECVIMQIYVSGNKKEYIEENAPQITAGRNLSNEFVMSFTATGLLTGMF